MIDDLTIGSDALALVAVGALSFTVALVGGLFGLVLGTLRLPGVLLVASSPAAGAGANLGISTLAAASAATAHVRGGNVDWRLLAWMAPPSIAGGLAGGYGAGVLPDAVLLTLIGAVLVVCGLSLLPRRRGAAPAGARGRPPRLVEVMLTGAGIGVLGGMVGLLLGSLRMPAMLRWTSQNGAASAVGTNVVCGVCVGCAGLLGHAPSGGLDWPLLAVGAATSIPGALLGTYLTGRLSDAQLVHGIATVLVIAGAVTIAQAASVS